MRTGILHVVAAELWLLVSPSIPLFIDKIYYVVCLFFQILLGLTFLPCWSGDCSSILIDVCHWAFVVLVFGGAVILRAFASVFLIVILALLTIVLRLIMGNTCLITA